MRVLALWKPYTCWPSRPNPFILEGKGCLCRQSPLQWDPHMGPTPDPETREIPCPPLICWECLPRHSPLMQRASWHPTPLGRYQSSIILNRMGIWLVLIWEGADTMPNSYYTSWVSMHTLVCQVLLPSPLWIVCQTQGGPNPYSFISLRNLFLIVKINLDTHILISTINLSHSEEASLFYHDMNSYDEECKHCNGLLCYYTSIQSFKLLHICFWLHHSKFVDGKGYIKDEHLTTLGTKAYMGALINPGADWESWR